MPRTHRITGNEFIRAVGFSQVEAPGKYQKSLKETLKSFLHTAAVANNARRA